MAVSVLRDGFYLPMFLFYTVGDTEIDYIIVQEKITDYLHGAILVVVVYKQGDDGENPKFKK
jgi:hypothetical protein